MFRDLEREQKVFTGIAAHVLFGANLAARKQTVSADGVMVSGSYFPVLELRLALGRLLSPDDDRQVGEARVVVLSYEYWQTASPATRGAERGGAGEREGVDDRWRGTARIRGHHARRSPEDFRADHPAQRTQRRCTKLIRSPDVVLGVSLCTAEAPGVTLEQASAAINVPYSAILSNVEAPLQGGLSEKVMAKFKEKKLELKPGARGQSSVSREART